MDFHGMQCCGLKELSDVSHLCGRYPGTALRLFIENYNLTTHKPCGAFIFTQAGVRSTYGRRLADFILKHELGTITEAPNFINPNSGRPIITFVWVVDWDKLRAWYHRG